MCMKNININTITFSKSGNDVSAIIPFDSREGKSERGDTFIEDFNVLLLLNVILSSKDEDPKQCIVKSQTYELVVRLTHIPSNNAIDIFRDTLCLNDNNIHKICRPIYELKKIISISNLKLPMGNGQYAIKTYIKNATQNDWYLQNIQTFWIKS